MRRGGLSRIADSADHDAPRGTFQSIMIDVYNYQFG